MKNSYLFVPGNRPDRIQKALASAADVVIIDLEDAVPLQHKTNVREMVRQFLSETDQETTKKICLRINDRATDFYREDVNMAATFPYLTIMLPKTSAPADVHQLAEQLESGQSIIPLIETAQGIINAYRIASSSERITRLAFGAVDYCYELSINISAHGQELIYPRSALVVASRAAGLQSPIDTVYTNISDKKGLIEDIHRAKTLGLFAKLCIHPSQLPHVNKLFGPSENDVAWAQKIVKAYEQALEQGLSAIQVDHEMVDLPVYKKALATIKKSTVSVSN